MSCEPAQKHGGSKVGAAQPCRQKRFGHGSHFQCFWPIDFGDLGAAPHLSNVLV